MTSAATQTPDPNRLGSVHKIFVAFVICVSVGSVSYSVNVLNQCRADRAVAKGKLKELTQANLAGAANGVELATTDATFKTLCSRCGVDN